MPATSIDLHFPAGGIDSTNAFWNQRSRSVSSDGKVYARTTRDAMNVRVFDAEAHRARGGSRPALAKYVPEALVRGWIVQDLNMVVGRGADVPIQLSNSGRVVTLVGVAQGNVYRLRAGQKVWTTPTNLTGDTPPLNADGIVHSAPNVQKLWYADGINWVWYDPVADTVGRWVASEGTLPVDSANNTPRLIETWRGRTVLSGVLLEPYGWYMSKVNDPNGWNYNPTNFSATQAIAGVNAPQGLMGDVVTSLCAYSDDRLIFFGDHSIYMMNGDPCAGGKLDLVTDTIGGVWGKCWARDPYGNIYFVSNKMGIYGFTPGQSLPQRISQPIEQFLQAVNTGDVGIRLGWDDRYQGLHVFITSLDGPTATDTHLFFEQRTQSWWKQKFANVDHNPLCCVIFDGNLPEDRALIIGSWDGYLRSFSPTAIDDDGTPILSWILLGPFNTPELDEMMTKTLQAIMGDTSGDVNYQVFVGDTAESATAGPAIDSGVWTAGRNPTSECRDSGYSIYLKISSTNRWAIEQIRMEIQTSGRVRARGF